MRRSLEWYLEKGDEEMTSINISKFRDNLYGYANDVLDLGDSLEVRTKKGDMVVMSKEEYSGLMETLYLMSHPGTWKEIKEGLEMDLNDKDYWISEDEVDF